MADPNLISTYNTAAKTIYEPAIQKDVFANSIIEKVLRKNIGAVGADGASKVIFHQYGRNTGVGSIAAGAVTLPNSGNITGKTSTVSMKYTYGSVSIHDQAIDATKKTAASFIQALADEMDSVKEQLQRQIARQWYSRGDGVICLVNGAVTGTTITVDTPTTGPTPTHYIEPGAYLYCEDGTTAAGSGNVRVVASVTDTTITFTASITVADNDVVAFAQVDGSTYTTSHNLGSTDKEMMGLQGLVDDGTNVAVLQGITRSSDAWFKSPVLENSGTDRNISSKLLNEGRRMARKFGDPKLIITTEGISDTYGEILETAKRHVNEMELDGGFTGVKYRNMVIYADYDAPLKTVFNIDPTSLSIEELTPIQWMQEDGAVLFRDTNAPVYRGTLKYYANLAAKSCRKNSRLDDITDPDA